MQVTSFNTLYVIFFNFSFGFQGEVIFKVVVIVMAFRVSNFELLAVFWKPFDFSYKLIIPIKSEMKFNKLAANVFPVEQKLCPRDNSNCSKKSSAAMIFFFRKSHEICLGSNFFSRFDF